MNTMTPARYFGNSIAAALCGLQLLSLVPLPAAADSFEPLHEVVKFGDLDISHQTGAAVLYGRIHTAARSVCAPNERSGSLSAKMRFGACVDKALADAVTAVNEPALLAIYVARTGKTPQALLAALHDR